ncbi:acid protease [Suillus decipiens]|nr:acid protease [Suillus decipiens]
MFSVVFLLALLAFSVTGSPVEVRNSTITLPMTRRLAFSNVTDLLRHDEARLVAFGKYSTRDRRGADAFPYPTVPLSQVELGFGMEGYTVRVAIGDPLTDYDLIVDSASAITWVGGALSPYFSFSGVNTNVPVAVTYPFGTFQGITYNTIICSKYLRLISIGTIWEDGITFSERVSISKISIGVASAVQNIAADGVLGIGPTLSGLGTLPNLPNQMVPTVIDRLFEEGTISRPVVGIFFKPTVANEDNNGELCFGGTNPKKYTRHVEYADISTIPPSSFHWGINQWIRYANIEILAPSPGIVDSGCTFLYLATDAYERYRAATGGTLNPVNGLLQISLEQYNQLSNLEFHVGGRILDFVPNAQIWPRSLNHKVNGGENDIFLVIQSLTTSTGAGYNFVNGYVFLQRFYTVFDSGRRRVGFAPTIFTQASTN